MFLTGFRRSLRRYNGAGIRAPQFRRQDVQFLRHFASLEQHKDVDISTDTRDDVASDFSDEELTEIETFGGYSVILPPEPHVFGVRHILRRDVPAHIRRPPYASVGGRLRDGLMPKGDGRIALGSQEEDRIRAAARLARDTLRFAGTLVQARLTLLVGVRF
jgi:hypothetical protein